MRIFHLTTFVQGGAGLAIAELALAQVRDGHEVTVVTSRSGAVGYGNYPDYLARLEAGGVAVACIDSLFDRRPDAHGDVSRFLEERLDAPGSPIVIHAHAAVPAAIGQDAAARLGRPVPVLQTMHGWGVGKTASQAAHDVGVLNRVDGVIVPAHSSATQLHALGVRPRHLAVVPYGVAPSRQPAADPLAARMRAWRRRGDLVLSCIGTIGARKNQALLVEALALLPESVRVQAVFVGDGDAESLRRHSDELGVADRVHVIGYRPDARRYLRESDALVLPSRSEGQPLAVLEAFCDAVPVLASRIPELVELIEDGDTGWLFEGENAADLATATARVAAAPDAARAIAARARKVYRQRFTIERMVTGYMQEYARVS
jgi:glycosyltransferase involved in cell wall biosynthesis